MPEEVNIPLCRHIKTNGTRCHSAALSAQDFCYFHVRLHQDHPAPLTAQQIVGTWKDATLEGFRLANQDPMTVARAFPRQNEFNFPPLEDADSVQLAGSMLFHALAQGQIHPARARILVKALHIVSSSMRLSASARPFDPAEVVRQVEQSADGLPLAPAGPNPAEPPTTQVQ